MHKNARTNASIAIQCGKRVAREHRQYTAEYMCKYQYISCIINSSIISWCYEPSNPFYWNKKVLLICFSKSVYLNHNLFLQFSDKGTDFLAKKDVIFDSFKPTSSTWYAMVSSFSISFKEFIFFASFIFRRYIVLLLFRYIFRSCLNFFISGVSKKLEMITN